MKNERRKAKRIETETNAITTSHNQNGRETDAATSKNSINNHIRAKADKSNSDNQQSHINNSLTKEALQKQPSLNQRSLLFYGKALRERKVFVLFLFEV